MHKLLFAIIGLLLVGLLFIGPVEFRASGMTEVRMVCDQPLTYRLGEVDPRFGITGGQMRQALDTVEATWSEGFGRRILQRTPGGQVVVNLVYDQRQQLSAEQQRMHQELKEDSIEYDRMTARHREFSSRYELARERYERMVRSHQRLVHNYNEVVSEWNQRGGITPEAEEGLKAHREEIDRSLIELRRVEREVEQLADQFNDLTSRLNTFVEESNRRTSTYNQRFAVERTFSQGEYVRRGDNHTINIYQFDDLPQLELVLAHEFGHALGIGHVANPRSIMYHVMTDQDAGELRLSPEDVEALQRVCDE